MNKFAQILKKILTAYDYIYIFVIIISLFGIFFVEDSSWKIIFISLSVLISVALISSVAQKFTEYYENIPHSAFNSTAEYKVTTKNSELGTRHTIENFEQQDEFQSVASEKPEQEQTNNEEKVDESTENVQNKIVHHFSGYSFDEEITAVRIIKKKKIEPVIDQTQDEKSMSKFTISEKEIVNVNLDADKQNVEELNIEPEAQVNQVELNTIENEKAENLEQDLTSTNNEEEIVQNFEKLKVDFPTNVFFENHPLFGDEPKHEFEYFISRILMIIKSTVTTNTVGLFLYEPHKKALKLYSYITENEQFILKDAEIPIDKDILSEIVNNSKPEILTNINIAAVQDILPYYNQSVEIKSFIGIPIFSKQQTVGILTLDSFDNETFNSNIIGYLGNFTKLLSSLLTSLNEKFELKVSKNTLVAINKYRSILTQTNVTFDSILKSAFESITDILGFENIGFCNFSSQTGSWQIQALKGNESFVKQLGNTKIDTSKALISRTLFQNEALFIAPIAHHNHIISPKEIFNENGYFISVPLQSINSNFGAIFVYGNNYHNVSRYDVEILKILSEHVASTIEALYYINIYQNYSQLDYKTGILNPPILYQRLSEEIYRSKDFKYSIGFATFLIDNYASYQDTVGLNQSIQLLVIEVIKSHLRPYDIIGFLDDTIIGVILTNVNINDIKIWAEKVRSEIANKYITINNHRYMFTLSIGASISTTEDDIDTLTKKTIDMLKESAKKSNSVTIF
jgi:diguanylate cyclase (GGDEF)-like protein